MRGALMPAVMLAAACYQPAIPAGARCSPSGECPGGEPCIDGVCGGAPDAPDAPPDTPPETMVIVIGEDGSQLRDTELVGYDPDASFGDYDHFSVDEIEHGLLWFDLSGVPGGLTVQKATLKLVTTDDADENNGTVRVYRLREAWSEKEATWIVREAGKAWSTPGAGPPSRDEAPIAELRPNRTYAPFDVALPVELVQAWLADPTSNFGLAFVRGSSNQHVHIGTRESEEWSKLTLELRP